MRRFISMKAWPACAHLAGAARAELGLAALAEALGRDGELQDRADLVAQEQDRDASRTSDGADHPDEEDVAVRGVGLVAPGEHAHARSRRGGCGSRRGSSGPTVSIQNGRAIWRGSRRRAPGRGSRRTASGPGGGRSSGAGSRCRGRAARCAMRASVARVLGPAGRRCRCSIMAAMSASTAADRRRVTLCQCRSMKT